MKHLIFAAALCLGSAAVAQSTGSSADQPTSSSGMSQSSNPSSGDMNRRSKGANKQYTGVGGPREDGGRVMCSAGQTQNCTWPICSATVTDYCMQRSALRGRKPRN